MNGNTLGGREGARGGGTAAGCGMNVDVNTIVRDGLERIRGYNAAAAGENGTPMSAHYEEKGIPLHMRQEVS